MQITGAARRLQGSDAPNSGTPGLRLRVASVLLTALLAGCSSSSSMNPVNWWHDLEGGEIAKQRPPPPGSDQPYPNLASVPPKPDAPDRAALENIADALVADRTNAQHLAEAAPLADPSSPSASPALFGKGTVAPPPPAPPSPPPGTQTASANLAAAEAPPAPPAAPPSGPAPAGKPADTAEAVAPPPAKAPVGAVQTAPLAPPEPAGQPTAQAAPPPPAPAAQPATQAAAQPAAPPPLPTTPPAPPSLPGMAAAPPPPPAATPAAPAASPPGPPVTAPPATAAAPPPPPPAAPTTVASATPSPRSAASSSISLTFVTGSADLPSLAADQLKQLAARRGNGVIAVTGYGDAGSNAPDAQAAALALGLSRAKAMAAALSAAGVPSSAVQLDAEAIGRGGTARLVQ